MLEFITWNCRPTPSSNCLRILEPLARINFFLVWETLDSTKANFYELVVIKFINSARVSGFSLKAPSIVDVIVELSGL